MNIQGKSGYTDRQLEEIHLQNCIKIIQSNIDEYTLKAKDISEETKELYDNYRSNNPELHNDLVLSLNFKSQIERTLANNLLAIEKPYFGRIDYKEMEEGDKFSLYLGKRGVVEEGTSKNKGNMLIVDWRAPISSVYYDSDIGISSYHSPFDDEIFIDLELKRTYEIYQRKLIDFYDANVIANDEFLTKYLGKNKEVVLGEIIATIQKEQNEIIRDTPWHSVIVQGVAGSGKTTVAMHRISYILYNYKDKFRPDEFYVIGSNKMLLNYITGVLPNLDVNNINQMTLEDLLLDILGKDFKLKKEKYTLVNSFYKLGEVTTTNEYVSLKQFKGSIDFAKAFALYLTNYELDIIPTKTLMYGNKVLYAKEDILDNIKLFKDKSLQEKIDLLNTRVINKVKLINEINKEEREVIRDEMRKYRHYFGKKNSRIILMDIYKAFLYDLIDNNIYYMNNSITIPGKESIDLLLLELAEKKLDIYDLSALTFIKKKLIQSEDFDYVSHIVVDEAQDFGVSVFYVLKQIFKNCTFTIMGDVTQNIYYHTGMNDWEALKNIVFHPEKDKFYSLAKSYRNTVEISNYASNVLKKCTFKTYDIEPIVRHGNPVLVEKYNSEDNILKSAVKIIKNSEKEGYSTIAVICRTVEEAIHVGNLLSPHISVQTMEENAEDMKFSNGVMVLPIHMTKGLEFDSVILWNPDDVSYRLTDADAKLLYVAITRALHELSVLYKGDLAKLLL
jgi:DNA helicase-2/ATP-dependent DNA helicase PcrA